MKEIKAFYSEKIRKIKYRSLLITLVVAGITAYGLLHYVANELGGNFSWIIIPSSYFGVPEDLTDEIETLCENGDYGWDGQFYYYIANDILGLKDTAQHIDSPSYRYQRIGLPVIVKVVSKIFLEKNVTVEMFTFVYFLILMVASFLFAKYLEEKNKSVLWILPWALSVGVQITLRHALPDGAADAFMLMAVLLLLHEKYIGYAMTATVASLCREANISIAAIIFLLGFFGLLKKEKKFDLKYASILAFPGVVFILWYGYVTFHFGAFPFSEAYGITDFFGKGFYEYFIKALSERNFAEVISLGIYACTIIISLILEWVKGKKNHIWWSLVPFTILLGSFGPTVMSHYSGYLKGISSLLIYIPMMILNDEPVEKNICDKRKYACGVFMAFTLIMGLLVIPKHATNLLSTKYGLHEKNDKAQALTDFSSDISVNEDKGAEWVDMPYSDLFRVETKYTIMNVHVENLSNQVWNFAPNDMGQNAVYLSYHWFKADDMENVICDGIRNSIRKDIEPGESIDADMYIEFPDKPGHYVLRLSLLQEAVKWFYLDGTGYVDINYIIQ